MFTRGRRQRGPRIIDVRPLLAKLEQWNQIPPPKQRRIVGLWILKYTLMLVVVGIIASAFAVLGLGFSLGR